MAGVWPAEAVATPAAARPARALRHSSLVHSATPLRSTAAAFRRVKGRGARRGGGNSGSGGGNSGSRQSRAAATQRASPARRVEADPELLEVLDLATDEELEDLLKLLYGRSLFSPLLKSLVTEREHVSAAWSGRDALIRRIDRRLRFLAADSRQTLDGRWPTLSYRQVLLNLRDKLAIRCPSHLLTNELEAEVFLHLLEQHGDAVAGAGPAPDAAAEAAGLGDGGAAAAAGHRQRQRGGAGLLQRLLAPLRMGQEEVLPALAQLASAMAVTNVKAAVMQKLGGRLVASHLRYEAALHLALSAGAKGVQGKVAVQAAKEGFTAAASRYAAARSLLGLVAPLMWASTALDLLWVSIGTDWTRVAKAVFALAQIRLLRTHGFSAGGSASGGGMGDSNGSGGMGSSGGNDARW